MQILEGIYFKEFHSRLIPLVIMNMKKKENEQSRKKSKLVSQSTIMDKKNITQILTIEEAYIQLLQQKPKNEFDVLIKNFLLDNLPPQFKRFTDENINLIDMQELESDDK